MTSSASMKFALFLHLVSVAVWVGGMFFAYMALRPAAVAVLQPAQRLPLWVETLRRFFGWVWLAVALILSSGLYLAGPLGGPLAGPVDVRIMFGVGLAMMLIFAHVYFAPFGRLRREVAAADWPRAGKALAQIRVLVGVNLVLGLANIAVATVGKIVL